MTIKEYFRLREPWLRSHKHPKTVNETRVAVEAFCDWLGSDPDIDDVTPKLFEQFEAAEETTRRRQLASNLLGLLRLYDERTFPRRSKALLDNAEHFQPADEAHANGDKPATFAEFAKLYVTSRVVCAGYARTLVKRAEQFQKWLGKSAIPEVCTEAAVNAFLSAIAVNGSAWTRNKWRQDILTLWRSAADDDLCGYPIGRRIRRERVEPTPIDCYTVEEARALVATAERLRGAFDNGIPRRHYWAALLRFAWDTGLRRSDCWRFERSMLKPDCSFRIVQSKTKKPIRRMLRPETLAAIDKIDSPTPLAWPMRGEWSFGFWFQRIMAAADVERGSFRWLRRATGSHVEAEHPGSGHKALGNTTQVFRTHYDADLAGTILMPPAL